MKYNIKSREYLVTFQHLHHHEYLYVCLNLSRPFLFHIISISFSAEHNRSISTRKFEAPFTLILLNLFSFMQLTSIFDFRFQTRQSFGEKLLTNGLEIWIYIYVYISCQLYQPIEHNDRDF